MYIIYARPASMFTSITPVSHFAAVYAAMVHRPIVKQLRRHNFINNLEIILLKQKYSCAY